MDIDDGDHFFLECGSDARFVPFDPVCGGVRRQTKRVSGGAPVLNTYFRTTAGFWFEAMVPPSMTFIFAQLDLTWTAGWHFSCGIIEVRYTAPGLSAPSYASCRR